MTLYRWYFVQNARTVSWGVSRVCGLVRRLSVRSLYELTEAHTPAVPRVQFAKVGYAVERTPRGIRHDCVFTDGEMLILL